MLGFFSSPKIQAFFIQAIRKVCKERDCWFFSFLFKLISIGKTGKVSGTQIPLKT